MRISRMRVACWIPKATNTHSEYIIFTVFPFQQWLRARASQLRYKYIACLVVVSSALGSNIFSELVLKPVLRSSVDR